jgi:hypothetical protein
MSKLLKLDGELANQVSGGLTFVDEWGDGFDVIPTHEGETIIYKDKNGVESKLKAYRGSAKNLFWVSEGSSQFDRIAEVGRMVPGVTVIDEQGNAFDSDSINS